MLKREPNLSHVKWILPHAPAKAVTANMNMVMPSWFDIYSFGFSGAEDETGMRQTVASLTELIEEEKEKNGIEPSRILLGGFSQGGAMSLLAGLTGKYKLAGIACLSGWLPLRHKFKEMASPSAATMPVFYGHGGADPLVKPPICQASVDFLVNEIGLPRAKDNQLEGLHYHVYPHLPHSVAPEELNDLKAFIAKCLPAEPAN
jgi:lysophospholipase-1